MSVEGVVVLVVLGTILWSLFGGRAEPPRLPTAQVRGQPAADPALPVPIEVHVAPAVAEPGAVPLAPPAEPTVSRRKGGGAAARRPVPSAAPASRPALDTGELRRAVLMAEVLGPPRALRPLGAGED